jgi:uncharacterized protein (TIGR03067 family)
MRHLPALTLLPLLACSSAPDPAPDDGLQTNPLTSTRPPEVVQLGLADLQGSWVGPSTMRSAEGNLLTDHSFEAKIEIVGDRLWLYAPDREPMELTIKLSEGFDPPFIDLTDPNAPGDPILGVYALSGSALLICSGKTRPTGVIPCDGPSQWFLALTSLKSSK